MKKKSTGKWNGKDRRKSKVVDEIYKRLVKRKILPDRRKSR